MSPANPVGARSGPLRRFVVAAQDRLGAVAILTAITAPLLLMVVGFALDYGYASYLNTRLAKATDAAVLAASSQTAATTVGGYANTAGLQTYGVSIFNENMRQLGLSGVSFTLDVASDGSGGVVVTGAYSYAAKMFFGRLLRMSSFPLSGSAKSTAHPTTYVNYFILVDVSSSMGIAATQADMAKLWNATAAQGYTFSRQDGSKGCVFACHLVQQGHAQSSYTTARQAGVTLRIDAAVSAIQNIIAQAANIAGKTKNISFGLYLLQKNPDTGKLVVRLTDPAGSNYAQPINNYSQLATKAATIDLGSTDGRGDTDLNAELSYFNSILPSNGSGASATAPLNYVVLITDGVSDSVLYSCGVSPSCVSAMDPNYCNALKQKATVGVIYTTYLTIYQDNTPPTLDKLYDYLKMQNVVPSLRPNLQACASSSDLFFEATEGPEIVARMQDLFNKTQPVTSRLTN